MKLAKEWLDEVASHLPPIDLFCLEAVIRQIQADALEGMDLEGMESALRIIEKVGTTGIEHEHLNAQQWLLRYFPEHA